MVYRFCRQIVYWCKKQGNKFYQKGKCNSPIFSTETAYALVECAKYRTITFSLLIKLVSLLFTPVYYLPAKPISHQLSRRECFYLVVQFKNTIYAHARECFYLLVYNLNTLFTRTLNNNFMHKRCQYVPSLMHYGLRAHHIYICTLRHI